MMTNKSEVNDLYDNFFLSKTFDSDEMKTLAQAEIEWLLTKIPLGPNSEILDVACGTGRHLSAFLKAGLNPTGVDYSTSCVQLAKKNNPSISSRIFEDDFFIFSESIQKKFDLVFLAGAIFVFEKMNIHNQRLATLSHILKGNGFLTIQFLNREAAIKKYSKPQKFWNDTDEHFCLDSRVVKDNHLNSEKIYISKLDGTINKYSDSVCLTSSLEIIESMTISDPKIKLLSIFDSFSNKEFDMINSLLPVMIFQKF